MRSAERKTPYATRLKNSLLVSRAKRQRPSGLRLSLNTWQAGLEAQHVIGLRLAKLAGGGNKATDEAIRMTSEKLYTLWEAQTAATIAALTGKSGLIPSRTLALYRRKMRANRKRLSHVRSKTRLD
jgi:hypothetical protein